MATTRFYLDMRAARNGQAAPLKLAISHKRETVFILLNVQLLPKQWDKVAGKVINHPNKQFLNNYLNQRKLQANMEILRLTESGSACKMRAKDIREAVIHTEDDSPKNENLFAARFKKFAEAKKESTKDIYLQTYSRMSAFSDRLEKLTFEEVDKDWLTAFETFLSKTSKSKNARNVHLRNIRAVFNDAIDDGITSCYPFRKFKIRPVATPKRSLSVEELRDFFASPTEEHARKYLDMFKLIFFLVGINVIDLCHLKEIRNGRVEYYRSKTNRFYSVKVEPEAAAIIDRYRGNNQLLDMMDRYSNHKDYMHRLNENLQKIGGMELGKGGKKLYRPLHPEITTYWARHSWATIAASLDIPKETIAAALGHGGNTVTDIYIDFDRKKIDEANRKVIDWVLYGTR